MSTFKINSKSLHTNATFEGEGVRVNVNCTTNEGGLVTHVNGDVTLTEGTERYGGSFDGTPGNGYSFNGVSLDDMATVVAAVRDIEGEIEKLRN